MPCRGVNLSPNDASDEFEAAEASIDAPAATNSNFKSVDARGLPLPLGSRFQLLLRDIDPGQRRVVLVTCQLN